VSRTEGKRDEVTGGWRRLHSDAKLHNLYFTPDVVRTIKRRRGMYRGKARKEKTTEKMIYKIKVDVRKIGFGLDLTG
jgi:hypothetical protein